MIITTIKLMGYQTEEQLLKWRLQINKLNNTPQKGLTNVNLVLYSGYKPATKVGNFIGKGGDAMADSRKGENNQKSKINFIR
ncbi:hypothetical protein ACFLWH_00745 [Chloroflexota bacterium]